MYPDFRAGLAAWAPRSVDCGRSPSSAREQPASPAVATDCRPPGLFVAVLAVIHRERKTVVKVLAVVHKPAGCVLEERLSAGRQVDNGSLVSSHFVVRLSRLGRLVSGHRLSSDVPGFSGRPCGLGPPVGRLRSLSVFRERATSIPGGRNGLSPAGVIRRGARGDPP